MEGNGKYDRALLYKSRPVISQSLIFCVFFQDLCSLSGVQTVRL